jgi:hypothetical protein
MEEIREFNRKERTDRRVEFFYGPFDFTQTGLAPDQHSLSIANLDKVKIKSLTHHSMSSASFPRYSSAALDLLSLKSKKT